MTDFVCKICGAITVAESMPWRCEKCTGRCLKPMSEESAPYTTPLQSLRNFAQCMLAAWPHGDVDGGYLQDMAIEHGLLRKKEPAPAGPCGDNCICADVYDSEEFAGGDVICYEKTPLMTGSQETSDPLVLAINRLALQAQGSHPAPCARMCEAQAFNIEIRRLRAENEQLITQANHFRAAQDALFDEPLRVIAVEAIREATGCPDLMGRDGEYLTDKLLSKARAVMAFTDCTTKREATHE